MPEQYAIIVGHGFDQFQSNAPAQRVSTRFGEPSSPVRTVSFDDHNVLVLLRHGEKYTMVAHEINYRANLCALQELGVTQIIALNTVGLVSQHCKPGELAIPDQLLDYTWGRKHTIYGKDAPFEHIDFSEPFSRPLREGLLAAAAQAGVACYDGGVYAATQGPRLETAAEVDRLERDGADYVGMTAMPEASLAMELGVAYACIALGVNPAAGRGEVPIHDDVAVHTRSVREATLQLLQQFFNHAES